MKDQPNILLIYTDQHHHKFLGCAGHPLVKTPNLDLLSSESTHFENSYCPSPVCGPSRSALFCGEYPLSSGRTSNDPDERLLENGDFERAQENLLTDKLVKHGYLTGLVGKLHIGPSHHPNGFLWKRLLDSHYDCYHPIMAANNDYFRFLEKTYYKDAPNLAVQLASESERRHELGIGDREFWLGHSWVDEAHHPTTWTADQSIRFIKEVRDERPFFLNTSFFGPHHPYTTCSPWSDMYKPDDMILAESIKAMKDSPIFKAHSGAKHEAFSKWDDEYWKQVMAQYLGNISMIDHHLGRIFQALKDEGIWNNTAIVFTSDHGDCMGELGLIGKSNMYDAAAKVPLIVKPPKGQKGEMRKDIVNNIDVHPTVLDWADISHNFDEKADTPRSLCPLLNHQLCDWEQTTFSSFVTPSVDLHMIRSGDDKCISLEHKGECLTETYNLKNDPLELDDLNSSNKNLEGALKSWIQQQST
jgi:arylsulfatase A-like enzyme